MYFRIGCLVVHSSGGLLTSLIGSVVHPAEQVGVPPEIVADYIHALVEADRTLYDARGGAHAGTWSHRRDGTLEGTRGIASPGANAPDVGWDVEGQGMGLRIRLTSLWPINKDNGPADDFERAGLEQVERLPKKPYTGIITQGDKRLFKVDPDRAVSTACIECHNGHESSRKRNYKLNDVMGGIVVSFPLH